MKAIYFLMSSSEKDFMKNEKRGEANSKSETQQKIIFILSSIISYEK